MVANVNSTLLQVIHHIFRLRSDVAVRKMAAMQTRAFSSLLRDKAYVNGQWVGAADGTTFEGIRLIPVKLG